MIVQYVAMFDVVFLHVVHMYTICTPNVLEWELILSMFLHCSEHAYLGSSMFNTSKQATHSLTSSASLSKAKKNYNYLSFHKNSPPAVATVLLLFSFLFCCFSLERFRSRFTLRRRRCAGIIARRTSPAQPPFGAARRRLTRFSFCTCIASTWNDVCQKLVALFYLFCRSALALLC